MKKILTCISFLLIIGCAASSERMRADDFYSKGEYPKALKSYSVALAEASTDSQRNDIQEKIELTQRKIVDEVLKNAERLYQQDTPPTLQSMDGAILALQNSPTDDPEQRISSQLKKYQDIKKGMIRHEAERLKSNGEYFNALNTYQRALEIDPEDKSLTDAVHRLTVFMEKEKKTFRERIEKALSIGDGNKAKTLFDKWVLIDPEDQELETLKKRISEARRNQLLIQARSDVAENRFFTAYTALKTADVDGLEADLDSIGKEGGRYYFDKAQSYFQSGKLHLAYIASVKGMTLCPNDINISQVHKKYSDAIDQEIQKYIAILTFGSPADQPGYGALFSDTLVTRLFKDLPYGINIVGKEKMDLINDSEKMKITTIGGSLGADIIINGNVSLLKTEENRSEHMATANVKIGEEEIINPEYENMVLSYGTDTQRWPRQPAKNIKKTNYEVVQYKKGKLSKRVYASVAIRIFDASTGKLVFSENFDDLLEKTDNYQDAVEAAGIEADPLELPSGIEMKSELRDKMIKKISDAIVELLQNREKRFWKSAALRMERNEYQNAVKFLAQGHVFCHKSKTDNEYSRKLYTMMTALTEMK